MARELMSRTPFSVYETFAGRTKDIGQKLLGRPVVEYIERYCWLEDELQTGQLSFPLLEIGSGSNWGLLRLQKNSPEDFIVGADIDLNSLHEGRLQGVQSLVQENLTEGLSFDKHIFRTVVCFIVLEQMPVDTIGQLLHEVHRVTTPGAKFVLATFNRELFSPHGQRWFPPDQYEYTYSELYSLVMENGWIPERRYGQRFVHRKEYLFRARLTQALEAGLKRVSGVQDSPHVQFLSPRLLNIVPSIRPYTTVEAVEKHQGREPVIDILVCGKYVR